MVGLVFSLIVLSKLTSAADLSGCLAPVGAGSKKMVIDKNCECVKTNSCIKFKPKTFPSSYYEVADKYGNRVYSNEEKVKLKESYSVFYKIMELKASGLSKSDEIKELYIKLDKLNYDVRKSLMRNHSSDYTEIKATYKKSLEERSKRNKKIAAKIQNLISTEKKSIAAFSASDSSKAPEPAKENLPLAQTSTKEVFKVSTKVDTQPSNEENDMMLRSLKKEKLNRAESDSLFDIISKSYQRSAFPVLLSP